MSKYRGKVNIVNARYAVNLPLSCNYFILKTIPHLCEAVFESCELEWREFEILMLLAVFVAVKTRKAATFTSFVGTLCTFSKVATVILYWRESPIHVLVFLFFWFLHFVFLPQPVYKGPQNIQYLRGGHLNVEIKRDERVTCKYFFGVLK